MTAVNHSAPAVTARGDGQVRTAQDGATQRDWLHFDLALGLGADLLPVVHDERAKPTPGSKVTAFGKIPSEYAPTGEARGIKAWQSRAITPADLAGWSADRRYSLCVRAQAVRAIDCDITDAELAERVAAFIADRIALPVRSRANSPKFLQPFRFNGELKKRRIAVGDKQFIELLADGQQFVAAGRHPSGAMYEWKGGLPIEIPELGIDELEALWAALAETFGIAPVEKSVTPIDRIGGGTTLASITDEQLADLKSALVHPALLEAAGDNDTWAEIGYALLSLRETGRALFLDFSAQAANPNAGEQTGESWWAAHVMQAPRSDFRHVYVLASRCGWRNPQGATTSKPEDFPMATIEPVVKERAPKHTAPMKGSRAVRDLRLMTNEDDKPFSNVANAERAIGQLLHGALTYDEFLAKVMIRWPEERCARPWEDKDTTRLQIWLQHLGMITMSAMSTTSAAELVASKHTTNVVADWLIGLEWDGIRRLSVFLPRAFGTPPDRYNMRAGRNMLIALVARALNPGCQVDEALVFEGEQGILKSSALRIIGGDYFQELTARPDSKDFEQQLRGVWLGEFSELAAVKRPEDIERLKQFVTNRCDRYRPSYGRAEVSLPRRVVFCGSTNKGDWNHDPTGARRFIPVEVARLDLEWLRQNREQLFAEAAVLYKAGRKWWKYPLEETRSRQEDRHVGDPWTSRVRQYLRGRSEVEDVSELLDWAVGMPVSSQQHGHLTRVGTILRKLGCRQQNQRRVSTGRRARPWTIPAEFADLPSAINGPFPRPPVEINNDDLIGTLPAEHLVKHNSELLQ